jgi:hypothetical protein
MTARAIRKKEQLEQNMGKEHVALTNHRQALHWGTGVHIKI